MTNQVVELPLKCVLILQLENKHFAIRSFTNKFFKHICFGQRKYLFKYLINYFILI